MVTHQKIETIKTIIDLKLLFVFDFDGVIADSIEVKTEAFYKIYENFGKEIAEKVTKHHKLNGGMSRFEKFRHYHKYFLDISIDDKELQKLCSDFSLKVKKGVIDSDEIKGATIFLDQLSTIGKVCAVNSATPQEEIKDIILQRRLSNYFSYIYGSPTSKEDNLKKVMSISGNKREEVIFFGDAQADLEAAASLGIDFFGIGFEMGKFIEENDYNYYYLEDFSSLLESPIGN